jgi:hypothetical protein
MILPQELTVDGSASKEVFVGGISNTKTTLEYMPVTDAEESSIEVTIVDAGGTFTWEEAPIPDDYNVKGDLPTVGPGARITLAVAGAVARLRWCEVVEYQVEAVEEEQ